MNAIAPPLLDRLQEKLGQEIGVSSWIEVDQARINRFAEATDDFQWIHTDAERARAESPFGGTIGHGFLSLSLLAPTLFEAAITPLGVKGAVNYGLDRVRFMSPVLSGKRVRNRIKLVAAEPKGQGVLITTENTVEIEGEAKPALIALFLVLLLN